ncbi:MAG: hydroxyacylglutathione hydrolase [Hyphomonadaceae bacterium]
MIKIHQFPCLSDNYGFLVHDPASGETAAIDTPDASKYLAEAEAQGWSITAIWNTHWHPDHAGGNKQIKKVTGCEVIGPAGEADKIPGLDRAVAGGDTVKLGAFEAHVLDVPGHTLGHIAYHIPEAKTALVGDALFALGCGRVFEGTMGQMWQSLQKLRDLPSDTSVYCAHEYTASNAAFAVTVDPENAALKSYVAEIFEKRARDEWTVPTTIGRETTTNPFLRADDPALQAAMGHAGDDVATFTEIRARKDNF